MMGYGTWPTRSELIGFSDDDLGPCVVIPVPDDLVLGWETCRTCHGVGHDYFGDPEVAMQQFACPTCFGAARFPVWMRECDRCDNEHGGDGKRTACLGYHEPSEYGPEGYEWGPCPAGCVDVGGRRMVPVRNGAQT